MDDEPNVRIISADIRFVDSFKDCLNENSIVFHPSAAHLESSADGVTFFIFQT
jgi:hypothetical protein